MVGRTAGPGSYYDKTHPVPFGEYIPLRSLLGARIPALNQIPSDMVRGTRPGRAAGRAGPAGVLMCFEVAYDGLLRGLVDDGADVIVVPTNNATYTGTGQIEQQFAMSRLRAIETGRYVVVASTNGISGIVAPDGHVVERAPSQQQRGAGATRGLMQRRDAGRPCSAPGPSARSRRSSLISRPGRPAGRLSSARASRTAPSTGAGPDRAAHEHS